MVCLEELRAILPIKLVKGVAIDPDFSADHDDAFWLEEENGFTILYLSISDVSSFVEKDSIIDQIALIKGFSRYNSKGEVIDPTLPVEISENKASILLKEIRPAITIKIKFMDGHIASKPMLERTSLSCEEQLSYYEAGEVLSNHDHKLFEIVTRSYNLARVLYEERTGCSFAQKYPNHFINEDGKIIKIEKKEQIIYFIVSEFAILANKVTSEYFRDNHLPAIYRVCPFGSDSIKYRLNGPAYYRTEPGFHCGLGVYCYTHATSPIRRFPDLVNQRILVASLEGHLSTYSEDYLNEICLRINRIGNIRREFMCSNVNSHGYGDVCMPQDLNEVIVGKALARDEYSELDAKSFSLTIVTALFTDKITTKLIDESIKRITNDRLKKNDLFFLFFGLRNNNQSTILKQMIAGEMVWHQDLPSHFLDLLKNKLGWSKVGYIISASKYYPEDVYLVSAIISRGDSVFVSQTTTNTCLDTAKYLAAFDLLIKISNIKIDLNPSEIFDTEDLSLSDADWLGKIESLVDADPILIINELDRWCGKYAIDEPQYEINGTNYFGFSCQCKVVLRNGLKLVSKSDGSCDRSWVKREAANLMAQKIIGRYFRILEESLK